MKKILHILLHPIRQGRLLVHRFIHITAKRAAFCLWLFFHESPYDKIGDAYMNGCNHYNDFLAICHKDGILPAILEIQQKGSYEAIGFVKDELDEGFFVFDSLRDAEMWSSCGGFPNDRAIIPLYGIVANNLVGIMYFDDTYFGQLPN